MWNARACRILRKDKLLKTRDRRSNVNGNSPPCPTITLGPLSNPTINDPYSDSVSPSGGASPYNLSVTIGALPTGLSLNFATGAVTGTASIHETQSFTIGGTDANGCPVTPRTYTLAVQCNTIALSDLAQTQFFAGDTIDEVITVNPDSLSGYTFSIVSGSLPENVELYLGVSGTCEILNTSHTTLVFGKSTFTIRATDNDTGCYGEKTYNIEVWAKFTKNTPVNITVISHMDIPVTISGTIGVDVLLESTEINITRAILDTLVVPYTLEDPAGFNAINCISQGTITGADLTNTVFSEDGVDNISTGTAPYTGTWFAGLNGLLDGSSVNGTWKADVAGTIQGTIDSITLTFKPI